MKDFSEFLENEIEDMATSHLECYRDRYASHGGNKNRMWEDVYVNHDTSLEIEYAEEKLKRDLSDDEVSELEECFAAKIMEKWENGEL